MSQKKYPVGYTSGVFDLFHVGHLNIIQRAKEYCDYLIVAVSTDELVQEYKHKTPVISFADRIRIVEAIRYVDCVVPQITMNKLQAWQELKFNVMFHGDEWRGTHLYREYIKQFQKVGVDVIFLPHTEGISSTKLQSELKRN